MFDFQNRNILEKMFSLLLKKHPNLDGEDLNIQLLFLSVDNLISELLAQRSAVAKWKKHLLPVRVKELNSLIDFSNDRIGFLSNKIDDLESYLSDLSDSLSEKFDVVVLNKFEMTHRIYDKTLKAFLQISEKKQRALVEKTGIENSDLFYSFDASGNVLKQVIFSPEKYIGKINEILKANGLTALSAQKLAKFFEINEDIDDI